MIQTLKQHQFLFRELVNPWYYLEHPQSTGRIFGFDADF